MNKFYFKLVGIIIITAILITISILVYIRIKIQNEKSELLHPGYKEFLFYLVKEIGKAPDKEKIKEIAETNNLIIQIKGKDYLINSNDTYFISKDFLDLKKKTVKRHKRRIDPKIPLPKEAALYFSGKTPIGIEFNIFNRQYVFIKLPNKNKQTAANYAIASIILFFLLFAGFMIKKSFVDPLHKLELAINAFSKNIYSKEILGSSGELHNLFNSFNKMKKEVANHIEEKERLLRDISHDLRSPITRMKVALELMDNSKIKEKVLTDVNELSYLVNQILDSQTENNFNLETIENIDFIKNYIQTHNFPMKVNVGNIDKFNFKANVKQLNRILNNLIDNSFKYSDNKKGVIIESYIFENKGVFKVSDSKSGIDSNVIDKIFQPFFKVDYSRRQDEKTGSGLGLTITKRLVLSMNGEITAYPSETEGLTVEFSFPLVD